MIDVAIASVHRPGVTVIDRMHWVVRAGEFWIVGGLPGAGKTDLLVTAAGLMRPEKGVVRLFGNDLSQPREEERLKTQLRAGIVFGVGGRLFSQSTVAENLALPLCYHRNCRPEASQERINAILDAMGLSEYFDVTPLTLNRNLRQRAALARALVLSPELLFLDDPFAETDRRESRWWLNFLDGLMQGSPLLGGKRLTIVVGTGDLQPWGERGRQFAYIHRRQFVPAGSRTDLINKLNPGLRELLPVDWLGE